MVVMLASNLYRHVKSSLLRVRGQQLHDRLRMCAPCLSAVRVTRPDRCPALPHTWYVSQEIADSAAGRETGPKWPRG